MRKDLLTKPIFKWASKALPTLSDTEKEALGAGDVWWDAELFSGNPNWDVLRNTKPAKLSKAERDFLDGPCEDLCQMLDDWQINWKQRDLPPKVWKFLKDHKFFAMIIPKKFGGLQFSPLANSEIIRKIACRSVTAAVTVMVPNSLGPGELLSMFGTPAQQKHWLPRLAEGSEIPCFGLTSPEAGSDAASMIDHGVVCKGTWKGKKVLGIKLNWHKRYITLGPVATVLGLAFKLYDPDHLVGDQDEIGITVALVPTDLKGIDIGKRHLPSMQMFQNGPNWGKDVFIPMDLVVGGKKQLGQGWKMLMTALAAGRGISLPSLSAAGTAFAARTSGSYARVREQFNIPIGKFEGVQNKLGQMAETAYRLDAARNLTCAGLGEGRKLAVISAIMKAHATEQMRDSINQAMDIHAGKTVIDGPHNYMGNLYRAIPIGITVEGANILTRNMIIFGQGSIRCHPWLLKEVEALQEADPDVALTKFDEAFWGHVSHSIKTLGRAFIRNWSAGRCSPSAKGAPDVLKCHYKQIGRYAASFALISDIALLVLGGGLKRKEMISARLGDVLSELYFLSAVLKRWEDEGKHEEDLPLVHHSMAKGLEHIEDRFSHILSNMPARPLMWFVKFIIAPLGFRQTGPTDQLITQSADILLRPSATRDRLTPGLYLGPKDSGVAQVEEAFDLVTSVKDLRQKMKQAKISDIDEAQKQGIITAAQAKQMKQAKDAVTLAVAVDHFTAAELKK